MNDFKSTVSYITGIKTIQYTEIGKFIKLSGDYADLDNPSKNSQARYAVVACNARDVFTLSAHGGNNARAYAWLDSEYKILSRAAANITLDCSIIIAPADTAYLVINTTDAEDKSCYGLLLRNCIHQVEVSTERGYIMSNNGALSNGQSDTYTRSQKMYEVQPGAYLGAYIAESDFETLQNFYFYCYDSDCVFLERLSSTRNPAYRKLPETCKYVKFATAKKDTAQFSNFTFAIMSDQQIKEVYNPDIKNPTITSSLAFCYPVSRDAITSGRLLLPPNYSVDGDKVPLIVFVHGSRGMVSWDSELGWAHEGTTADSYLPLLQYLTDEGFAVFDCYPWTNKESIDEVTWSPMCLPVCKQAYLAGIRYVCSRFNIDINKVSMIAKSQGGNIGHWAATQKLFPFKAICLLAPATGIGYTAFLFNASVRKAVAKYLELDATPEELSVFISPNSGLNTPEVRSVLDKNKYKFVAMAPFVQGITNGNADDFYDVLTTAGNRTVPTWLIDHGAPEPPTEYAAHNTFVNHSEYVKSCDIPVKFWCAFDDTNVGNYGNYAIYQYMVNGGSDASWRTLPNGTGAHHAMDTAPEALKSSGTTALGIPYTDIATGYVEAVDFIRLKMGD